MHLKTYCTVSGALFTLVAFAHLMRIVFGLDLQVADVQIPMFVSWFGFVGPGSLAVWAFRTGRASGA